METTAPAPEVICFETHPDCYKHLKIEVDGPVARILIDIQEHEGLRPGYALKLNSYDLSVDIELADAVQRLRFEHPEVGAVIVTSAQEGVFSSGANIFMLGASTHAHKVNFCKFTNETRVSIEDATANSGQVYIAALNGVASGGGYELPQACEEIYLVDDRRSAVSLPEIPYLGVLPGTGGLTRLVDKRHVRRDIADVFVTLAEGVKGKRAVQWGLVDAVFPTSKFKESVDARALEVANGGKPDRKGITLEALEPTEGEERIDYRHVSLELSADGRTATIEITVPDEVSQMPSSASDLGSAWFPLRAFRELDDALLRLRLNYPMVGLILFKTRGNADSMVAFDEQLDQHADDWFVNEVRLFIKRTLKRVDYMAKSMFAIIDEGSCFVGTLYELALAADRSFMLEEDGVSFRMTNMNQGAYPMGNGLSRMQTRFVWDQDHANALSANRDKIDADEASDLGLITVAADDIDWDDEVRLAIEERVSLSPDSLTGMEASIRFGGPETLETKIFGRLTAWQNWIFQRPNAVGPKGALTLYGRPESPEFDFNRT
ncbi:MAG: 2,3-epoxybenzoyl-CoA dihydrolase [Planctomycetota bacterium]|jgi:benzoyl-CoA-dihydrodiol lyase|nr:2,3-epoxybenzoyl-CoA dihydrolase [Planctomycetota bacterium]